MQPHEEGEDGREGDLLARKDVSVSALWNDLNGKESKDKQGGAGTVVGQTSNGAQPASTELVKEVPGEAVVPSSPPRSPEAAKSASAEDLLNGSLDESEIDEVRTYI